MQSILSEKRNHLSQLGVSEEILTQVFGELSPELEIERYEEFAEDYFWNLAHSDSHNFKQILQFSKNFIRGTLSTGIYCIRGGKSCGKMLFTRILYKISKNYFLMKNLVKKIFILHIQIPEP